MYKTTIQKVWIHVMGKFFFEEMNEYWYGIAYAFWFFFIIVYEQLQSSLLYTVKPPHEVTFINQSSLLKGHNVLSYHKIFHISRLEPLLRGHLSYEANLSLPQRWPLNTSLIVFINKYIFGGKTINYEKLNSFFLNNTKKQTKCI